MTNAKDNVDKDERFREMSWHIGELTAERNLLKEQNQKLRDENDKLEAIIKSCNGVLDRELKR